MVAWDFLELLHLSRRPGQEHQESLCLWLDGVRHYGILGPDGRRLSWADGVVWLRRERQDPELEEAHGERGSRRDGGWGNHVET